MKKEQHLNNISLFNHHHKDIKVVLLTLKLSLCQ